MWALNAGFHLDLALGVADPRAISLTPRWHKKSTHAEFEEEVHQDSLKPAVFSV